MSIAEVAEMVGIKSASHFSKIFENEVGESPSKFRKVILTGIIADFFSMKL